ncbi:hypothetical protein [Paenibacillus sp. EPM92]|uniref:hypothetical protein n=1 Tax=Paenibacillus sp. EPM92 TaxID=1561195 RepID=UPI00191522E6|nr:hypothetical protein [Paenibacillus sp. EPM92]
MNIDDHLEELYTQVGERCPYKAATHLGIIFDTKPIGDEICGIYMMFNQTPAILLNCNVDIETQETTLYLLIKQHKSHMGFGLALNKTDLANYERVESVKRFYFKEVAETFLGFMRSKSQQA